MSTNCCYCGEELWGHEERNGVCVGCQRIEEEMREPDPVTSFDDDEPAPRQSDE